jgi:hypothetical protein
MEFFSMSRSNSAINFRKTCWDEQHCHHYETSFSNTLANPENIAQ